jgi:hypothetical protein
MEKKPKISTGANDRPRNESIAQTAGGLADESRDAMAIDDAEVERVRAKLMKNDGAKGKDMPGAAGRSSAGDEEDTYD